MAQEGIGPALKAGSVVGNMAGRTQLKKELHLETEDYRILEGLGKSLQGARLENCLGQLSQVQDYFHSQQAVLEQAILEQSRMYKTIGILAGILVMVVLA